MTAFVIANLPGPPGSLQRARLYYPAGAGNPAGGTVLDLALAESPAGSFSGTVTPTDAQAAYPGDYEYEVRQVTAQTDGAFDASTIVTLSRGAYGPFTYAGRYTTQAAVRTWLGAINADVLADLDGDGAPDAGAWAQAVSDGEDEVDHYASGGDFAIPLAFTGGTAGEQAYAARVVGRWARVLAGWALYAKRPAAKETTATLDEYRGVVIRQVMQAKNGFRPLPGLAAAASTPGPQSIAPTRDAAGLPVDTTHTPAPYARPYGWGRWW